ncbi:MAG: flagellar motor stator protein MotA [bacterium]|jgi:chemotaxis protein MotA
MTLVGLLVVFGAVIGGFAFAGGKPMVLMQISEFIVIGGAAFGSILVANPPSILGKIVSTSMATLKGSPYTTANYLELLKMFYELFQLARREGLLALETHIEHPHESELLSKYPAFLSEKHAVEFLADTMKVVLTGTVQPHDLLDMMDMDLERHHEEAMIVPGVITKIADAMPGFGIIAAVLGVVLTMGAIGGPPEVIGEKVGAALVGTFLGVLLAYGVFGPLAVAMESLVSAQSQYYACIKQAILSFARGDSPMTAVEFARRNIEPSNRPSLVEMENAVKNKKQAEAA